MKYVYRVKWRLLAIHDIMEEKIFLCNDYAILLLGYARKVLVLSAKIIVSNTNLHFTSQETFSDILCNTNLSFFLVFPQRDCSNMSLLSHCGLQDNGMQDLANDELSTGVSNRLCQKYCFLFNQNVLHNTDWNVSLNPCLFNVFSFNWFCLRLLDDHHSSRLRRWSCHRSRFPNNDWVRKMF